MSGNMLAAMQKLNRENSKDKILDSIVKSNIVRVYDTTGRNIPASGVRTVVQFDTVDFDPKGLFDTVGGKRIYFKYPGYYLCGGGTGFIDAGSGAYQFIILLVQNGHTSWFVDVNTQERASTKSVFGSVSGIIRAGAGEFIELQVQQDSANAKTTVNAWSTTNLWATKLH